MVWGAATSRSSGGRSAVQTTSGTSAWWASTTAAWSSAAAVPLVHTTTAGPTGRQAEPEGGERRPSARRGRRAGAARTARRGPAPAASTAIPGRRRRRRRPARTTSSARVAQNVAATELPRRRRGGRAHRPIVYHDAGRDLVRRRVPVVLHRQAALRGGPRPLPRARRRDGRVPRLPARPDRASRRGHVGPRGLRPQVRPRPGRRSSSTASRRWRRRSGWTSTSSGRSGPTPSLAHQAAVAGRAAGPPGGHEGAAPAGLLHRGPQRRRPGRPGRPGRRGRPRPRRGRGRAGRRSGPRRGRGARSSEATALDIAAVPTYVFDRRWSVPGAQDPETFLRVLERVAELEAAASEPA